MTIGQLIDEVLAESALQQVEIEDIYFTRYQRAILHVNFKWQDGDHHYLHAVTLSELRKEPADDGFGRYLVLRARKTLDRVLAHEAVTQG